MACDLLAVDEAYPVPVADQDVRHDAHQAWRHGQVLLVGPDDRLTLAVPGTRFGPDLVLDALARLAKAVGAPDRYAVLLRIGTDRSLTPTDWSPTADRAPKVARNGHQPQAPARERCGLVTNRR